jgi:hypothetical protein
MLLGLQNKTLINLNGSLTFSTVPRLNDSAVGYFEVKTEKEKKKKKGGGGS